MLVSVSTMPAGEKYFEYTKQVESFADFMHLDVCDGEYNKNTCFNVDWAKKINDFSTIPLDCHLMVKHAIDYAEKYIKAGVNIITAQIESFDSVEEIRAFISFVQTHNALVGLSLEPETSISTIKPFLSNIDIAMVMSVKTGASGQEFNTSAIQKIKQLYSIKTQNNLTFKIEVDGGITNQTANIVKLAGADIVVSGKFVFDAQDKQKTIQSLK